LQGREEEKKTGASKDSPTKSGRGRGKKKERGIAKRKLLPFAEKAQKERKRT